LEELQAFPARTWPHSLDIANKAPKGVTCRHWFAVEISKKPVPVTAAQFEHKSEVELDACTLMSR